jgi:hypothetical protein
VHGTEQVADGLEDYYFPAPNVLSFSKIMYIHFHAKAKFKNMDRKTGTRPQLSLIKNITSEPMTRPYEIFLPLQCTDIFASNIINTGNGLQHCAAPIYSVVRTAVSS